MVAHAVTVFTAQTLIRVPRLPSARKNLDGWVGDLAHCGLISVGPVAPLISRTFYTYSHTLGLSSPFFFFFFSTTHI
jgi:hypothetical protein